MNVRCHVSAVFVLDKSHGCGASSLACKETWTDRPGSEYAWWHNAETRPGTGYPQNWEDQDRFHGGWQLSKKGLTLSATGRIRSFLNIFHDPSMPTLDDYYEPWDYERTALRDRGDGAAVPELPLVSLITGEPTIPAAGPNWDDALAGSDTSADRDPNLKTTAHPPEAYFELPRICNHCLNPSCVAACPSGAAYKRGEDGLVLIDQERCRSWRSCVPSCPYKKIYFNWQTGKSEKCHLCYPLTESGQASICSTAAPGGDQFLGVLLYDSDRIEEAAEADPAHLVDAFRSIVLDPSDGAVRAAARQNRVSEQELDAALKSPVYRLLIDWRLALPLHPEWRTLPMVFYVPPLMPHRGEEAEDGSPGRLIDRLDVPADYLASLFSAGDQTQVRYALTKLAAVRHYATTLRRSPEQLDEALRLLEEADCSRDEAESIHALLWSTGLSGRVVLPDRIASTAGGSSSAARFSLETGTSSTSERTGTVPGEKEGRR